MHNGKHDNWLHIIILLDSVISFRFHLSVRVHYTKCSKARSPYSLHSLASQSFQYLTSRSFWFIPLSNKIQDLPVMLRYLWLQLAPTLPWFRSVCAWSVNLCACVFVYALQIHYDYVNATMRGYICMRDIARTWWVFHLDDATCLCSYGGWISCTELL